MQYIELVRAICLGMPAVMEDVKWDNDLVFSVGGKMFCIVSLDQPFKCSFKVPDEAYDELSTSHGFLPAPYMARAKWVLVTEPGILHNSEWLSFISKSYDLVKAKLTRKQRQELGI